MKYLIVLFLVAASSLRLWAGDNLGSGQPGLKIIYKGTNQFVIYLDEPWTVGVGTMGGMDTRQIEIVLDRNYGLKQRLQSRTGPIGEVQQLYPFDGQRGFTCELADLGFNPAPGAYWPHQYGLTTNQYFLGKIGMNIFYWEMGDPRKAYCRPADEKQAAIYFELPKSMIDLFGVTKGVKKDVGFVVLKKTTGFFSFYPNEDVFLEFSFKDAKRITVNQ
jgi:hypothetical protein